MKAVELLKVIEEAEYDYHISSLVTEVDFDVWFERLLASLENIEVYKEMIWGRYVAADIRSETVNKKLNRRIKKGVWLYTLTGHDGDFILKHYDDIDKAKAEAYEDIKNEFCTTVIVVDIIKVALYLIQTQNVKEE